MEGREEKSAPHRHPERTRRVSSFIETEDEMPRQARHDRGSGRRSPRSCRLADLPTLRRTRRIEWRRRRTSSSAAWGTRSCRASISGRRRRWPGRPRRGGSG
jgi:hypothetical protein